MYNSIWVMLHKFSVFSMFLNWWLLDFASCVCVWGCVCVCVCVGWRMGERDNSESGFIKEMVSHRVSVHLIRCFA